MDRFIEKSNGNWYVLQYFICSHLENRNARNASRHKYEK